MMSEVTPQLFIGKAKLSSRPDLLHEFRVTSVVKLYHSPPDWPVGFRLLDAPIEDGQPLASEKFEQFNQFIASEIDAGYKVVVVCGAGISRSATVVLSSLVYAGMLLPDAFNLLIAKHPFILPHPELWQSLIAHHKLPYTLREVLNWRGSERSLFT